MGLWAIIVACFIAYVIADAAWDISKKIHRFIRFRALPWIRGAWGAVWGRLPKRAAPAVAGTYSRVESIDQPDIQPDISIEQNAEQNRVRVDLVQIAAFLWKAKWAILIAVIFVSGVALMRGCTPIWAKSRDTLAAELKEARITETVTAHEAGVATKAIVLAEETHRDRDRVRVVVARTNEEIADAVEASDFDRLHAAYERGTYGVWNDLEPADSPDPASPGTAPVRRPGADAARGFASNGRRRRSPPRAASGALSVDAAGLAAIRQQP